jgi:transcriptional regulator with XRE-family HTH domain
MSTTAIPPLDLPRLRGVLAMRRISRKAFAEAAGISQHYAYRILAGSARPGELSRMKFAAAICRLGLDDEEVLRAVAS